jgi:alcohol dehydrogenase class IV
MSLAATLAGLAFTSGGLGAVHALSNPLGTEYRLSHGRSNAVMLPYIVDYNKIGDRHKYARVAQALGEDVAGLPPSRAAAKLVSALIGLLEALDIPTRISEYGVSREDIPKLVAGTMKSSRLYGVSREDIPKLVAGTMKSSRLFVPNPRDMTEEDVEKVFMNAL